jgi:hypothetical protein
MEHDKETHRRCATIEKQREAESGVEIPFHLKPVVIGTNQAGEIITSCVLSPDMDASADRREKQRPLTTTEVFVMRLLDEAIAKAGSAPKPENTKPAPGVKVVPYDLLRRYYLSRTASDNQKEDTRRAALRRVCKKLVVDQILDSTSTLKKYGYDDYTTLRNVTRIQGRKNPVVVRFVVKYRVCRAGPFQMSCEYYTCRATRTTRHTRQNPKCSNLNRVG